VYGVTRRLQPRLTIALPVLALVVALLVAIAIPRVGLTLSLVLLATAGLLAVWAFAATRGALAPTLYATGFVLVTLVPDVALNAGVEAPRIALVALIAGLLLWHGRAQLEARDVAVLLMAAGALFPALVSSELAFIPGTLLVFAGPYALGRVWQPGRWRLVRLLLVVGAIHGFIAIGYYVPELRLVVQSELSGTRGSGLFNNPNTLGVYEAIALIAAFVVGVPRRWWPLAALCLTGLVLSSSREALGALVVGIAVVGLRYPRRSVAFGSGAAIVAAIATVFVPTLLARLDPTMFSSDPALLDRYRTWSAAIDLIGRSPWIGFGAGPPVAVVDQAFLGWLLAGGVVSLVALVGGIALLAATARVWPIVLAMVVVAFLANPFSGATLGTFLLVVGSGGVMAERHAGRSRNASPVLANGPGLRSLGSSRHARSTVARLSLTARPRGSVRVAGDSREDLDAEFRRGHGTIVIGQGHQLVDDADRGRRRG
jgi:O-Antigen ligase.